MIVWRSYFGRRTVSDQTRFLPAKGTAIHCGLCDWVCGFVSYEDTSMKRCRMLEQISDGRILYLTLRGTGSWDGERAGERGKQAPRREDAAGGRIINPGINQDELGAKEVCVVSGSKHHSSGMDNDATPHKLWLLVSAYPIYIYLKSDSSTGGDLQNPRECQEIFREVGGLV